MARLAHGDAQALDPLVDRHQAAVLRYLRALTGSEQAAEDALQETFVAAWRGAAGWRAEGSVRGWLFGLARRQAARTWRLRAGEPRKPEPLEELAIQAGWGDPEADASAHEDASRLQAALDRLEPEDREVLILRDLEQMSGPEAAQVLGLGLAAQKSRLHRARLRLMAALNPEALNPEVSHA